jgi:hypothetical protein
MEEAPIVRIIFGCLPGGSGPAVPWLALLSLLATGCGGTLKEPVAPPPGVDVEAIREHQAKEKRPTVAAEPEAQQGWPGTRQWSERVIAIDALRRIGPSALPALVELLHGPDARLRESAARAIALMGPVAKAAVPDLEAALSDLDPAVRKNVIRALGQMGPAAEAAIPALVQEIHKSEPTPGSPTNGGMPTNTGPRIPGQAPGEIPPPTEFDAPSEFRMPAERGTPRDSDMPAEFGTPRKTFAAPPQLDEPRDNEPPARTESPVPREAP